MRPSIYNVLEKITEWTNINPWTRFFTHPFTRCYFSYEVFLLSDTISLRDNIVLIYKRKMLSGALTFSSLQTTRQGLRDIALYEPFIARAEILRRRYLTISLVRLGQAGEKSCFSSSRVRQQLPVPMALFRFYKGNTIRAFDRDRRSTLMRSSIMIATSESDKVYEFIAARMILIVEIIVCWISDEKLCCRYHSMR